MEKFTTWIDKIETENGASAVVRFSPSGMQQRIDLLDSECVLLYAEVCDLKEKNIALRNRVAVLEKLREETKRLTWTYSQYQLERVADALKRCEPC